MRQLEPCEPAAAMACDGWAYRAVNLCGRQLLPDGLSNYPYPLERELYFVNVDA